MTRAEFENKILPVNRNLYRFAFRLLSSREEAEDAVQEVFVKLWKMRDRLLEYRSTEALAMTMTRNHCLDILRKRGRIYTEDLSNSDVDIASGNPEQIFEKGEMYQIVIKIIEDLPEKFRSVIQLKDIDGYDYEEISEKLKISVSNLRVNLSRGRKMVREQLKTINYETVRS